MKSSAHPFPLIVFCLALFLVFIVVLRVVLTTPTHPVLTPLLLLVCAGAGWFLVGLSFKS